MAKGTDYWDYLDDLAKHDIVVYNTAVKDLLRKCKANCDIEDYGITIDTIEKIVKQMIGS